MSAECLSHMKSDTRQNKNPPWRNTTTGARGKKKKKGKEGGKNEEQNLTQLQ